MWLLGMDGLPRIIFILVHHRPHVNSTLVPEQGYRIWPTCLAKRLARSHPEVPPELAKGHSRRVGVEQVLGIYIRGNYDLDELTLIGREERSTHYGEGARVAMRVDTGLKGRYNQSRPGCTVGILPEAKAPAEQPATR
jgi:hypothetical protein